MPLPKSCLTLTINLFSKTASRARKGTSLLVLLWVGCTDLNTHNEQCHLFHELKFYIQQMFGLWNS